jgi:hypothetical protein
MANEPQYLYLTTTGRKTGVPREIEIWFIHLDSRYYLISEKRERSNWVQNILHNHCILFRVGDRSFNGMGRVVDEIAEPDLSEKVCRLFDRKYGWSAGLIIELIPDETV